MPGCPDLQKCLFRPNMDYFNRVCLPENKYHNCFRYGREHGLMKTPIEWLQEIAIQTDEEQRILEEKLGLETIER